MMCFTPDESAADPRRVLSLAAHDKVIVAASNGDVYSLMPFPDFTVLARSYGAPYRRLLIDALRPFFAVHPDPNPEQRALLCATFFRLQASLCQSWARGVPPEAIGKALSSSGIDPTDQLAALSALIASVPPTRPRDIPALEFDEACHQIRAGIPLSTADPLAVIRHRRARSVAVSTPLLAELRAHYASDPYLVSLWGTLAESASPFFKTPDEMLPTASIEVYGVSALLIDAYDRRLPFDALLMMLDRLRQEPGGLAMALAQRAANSRPN